MMHGMGKDSEAYFFNSDKRLKSIGKTEKNSSKYNNKR
jgi:hypothetical protein